MKNGSSKIKAPRKQMGHMAKSPSKKSLPGSGRSLSGGLPAFHIPGVNLPDFGLEIPAIGSLPDLAPPPLTAVRARLEIVGMIPGHTVINAADSNALQQRQVAIDVPASTQFVLPSLSGWMLGYGAVQENADGTFSLPAASEQSYGRGLASVTVLELHEPVPPAATKTVVVNVSALFQRGEPRANWSAIVGWSLLLLRVA
jgi:hypothetical protein